MSPLGYTHSIDLLPELIPSPRFRTALLLVLSMAPASAQQLSDPGVGTLSLVTPDPLEQAKLDRIDGLAFDAFDNLIGAREIVGASGGAVYVDKATGVVSVLVTGISRADQIALHTSGDLFITSEVLVSQTTDRIFRLSVGYDASNVPTPAGSSATSLTTSLGLEAPEGLIVLGSDGAYGSTGDLYVTEEVPGNIVRIQPGTGTTSLLIAGLATPEGMAFGDFGGALPAALYVAETNNNRVLRIDSNGTATVLGDPGPIGLTSPDNVEFGPDGFLYVGEDRDAPNGRIIRIAPDGTHTVFATAFDKPQGMIFDPSNGDMYIAEQAQDRIWRLRFAGPPVVPTLPGWWLPVLSLGLLAAGLRVLGRRRA